MEVKQVIVIRKDLGMRRGKEIAQGAHASIAWLTRLIQHWIKGWTEPDMCEDIGEEGLAWLQGAFTKIVVKVNSEEELLDIHKRAVEAGLTVSLIKDAGRTEFKEPTYTAVAIGPNEVSKVDAITGELELY